MKELEIEYAKKHRRKKAAAIIALVGAGGVTSLAIVAFLGQYTGTFTVTLGTGGVQIALSEKSSFSNPTSYLHVGEIKTYEEYTFEKIREDESHIDSDSYDYLYGANYDSKNKEVVSMDFFKYTFFLKNVGNSTCRYDFKVKITENKPSKDGRYIDNLVRVMIYENDGISTDHDYTVYAKRSEGVNYDEDGNPTQKEYISIPLSKADAANPFPGFAEEFENDTTIATIPVSNFNAGDMKRYTIVTWVEGEDPQSNPSLEAPEGANMKLGVEINAYEN